MTKKNTNYIHVIPRNNGWAVRTEGKNKVTSVHDSQSNAIDSAREIARNAKGVLVIHSRDGRIRERDSYGSDPLPPKTPREVLLPTSKSKTSEQEIRKAVIEVIQESQSTTPDE